MFLSFELPRDRIAERPVSPRENAKLLSVSSSGVQGLIFKDLVNQLSSGDLLVLNKTRVMPARFFAKRERDKVSFEILLLKKNNIISEREHVWLALIKPLKKLKTGDVLVLSSNLKAQVFERQTVDGKAAREIELKIICSEGNIDESLIKSGLVPIPPYIRKGKSDKLDKEDYQTVYSDNKSSFEGSMAAPTAGLHFSEGLLNQLESKGVLIDFLDLEVGLASVREVEPETLNETKLTEEFFSISEKLKKQIKEVKQSAKKVVAVGTTSIRALESAALSGLLGEEHIDKSFSLTAGERKDYFGTELFIKPDYKFKIIDKAITNFHLPNSSHLLIVNALLGSQLTEKSYNYALSNGYRFFSYGDAMIVDNLSGI